MGVGFGREVDEGSELFVFDVVGTGFGVDERRVDVDVVDLLFSADLFELLVGLDDLEDDEEVEDVLVDDDDDLLSDLERGRCC